MQLLTPVFLHDKCSIWGIQILRISQDLPMAVLYTQSEEIARFITNGFPPILFLFFCNRVNKQSSDPSYLLHTDSHTPFKCCCPPVSLLLFRESNILLLVHPYSYNINYFISYFIQIVLNARVITVSLKSLNCTNCFRLERKWRKVTDFSLSDWTVKHAGLFQTPHPN